MATRWLSDWKSSEPGFKDQVAAFFCGDEFNLFKIGQLSYFGFMSDTKTRTQIIEAADRLFYQQGFDHTSFADIANAVEISRGNFYHHFKSKDEILDAVIDLRLINTRKMLDQWEQKGMSPKARIKSFIDILVMNLTKIKAYGCPVGTLCSELAKLDHRALVDASQLFTLFRTWLKEQFQELGHRKEADGLAMHILARSQGVATLASTFQDEKFVMHEVKQMHNWLNNL